MSDSTPNMARSAKFPCLRCGAWIRSAEDNTFRNAFDFDTVHGCPDPRVATARASGVEG